MELCIIKKNTMVNNLIWMTETIEVMGCVTIMGQIKYKLVHSYSVAQLLFLLTNQQKPLAQY